MAVDSCGYDYNKPYSPESSEQGSGMDLSVYTPSPVQHYTSIVATSSNAPDDKIEHRLSSSSVVIDMDDGEDDNSSHSDSPSFKTSLQTTVFSFSVRK